MKNNQKIAVVTGASAGIGEACARALAADGWTVVLAARRLERLEKIAAEIGGRAVQLDVTDDQAVEKFAAELGACDLLVNNAGGARGLDAIEDANLEDWRWMYDTNVLGTLRMTKALMPALLEANGLVINIGSVAGRVPYVGGAGYNAAKHGVAAMSRVLRLETHDKPLRVCEIDPGRVETDFSLLRFKGDEERARQVYEGKLNLQAEDIGEAVRWVASLPAHVNIDTMLIMPADQV
ncbi:SDR family oxidoreductase [Boudabousia liubingyangii]|uniref:SDR family NAD(P)-dependent oxidoreductase n=1 Tax=Boudabousia liubingyangii TaxID=1921764 RepID=UPI00093A5246|nr:SDR family oxidoreductase [Boudabousia liubingyangii]OKL47112.1 SDR family oxidoreductase [Boudabousia liubingyangii]